MGKPIVANAGESSGPEGGPIDTNSTRRLLLGRALRAEGDVRQSAERIALYRHALQDLLNRVADVCATMDDDAEVRCPWCGRNPHWKQCDILPIMQYAQAVLHGKP